MKFAITLFFFLQLLRINAQPCDTLGHGGIYASLQGVTLAENVKMDSSGLFVRFEGASFDLLFSQSVNVKIDGLRCTFAATIFVVSMHPVTVLAITDFGDYVQAVIETGSATAEIDGNFLSFQKPVHSND